jgi:transcriptional regulator with XRE-family HTH domain
MEIHQAFRRAMFEYRVNGSELARQSGVDQSRVSQFANGKAAMTSKSLDKMFASMPLEAHDFMLSLLSRKNLVTPSKTQEY